MKSLTVRLPDDLHAEVTTKAEAELRPINAVVRRLLEMWVDGEIMLRPPAPKSDHKAE